MSPNPTLTVSKTFHRGYELCAGNGLTGNNGQRNALIPSIVCLAFSIELAFKSILQSLDIQIYDHNFVKLYEALHKNLQAEVIRLSTFESTVFLENLQICSNAFIDWRYIHENPGLHFNPTAFLLPLQEAIYKIAEDCVEAKRIDKTP